MTLSHAQFKDLDERKFKLWSKKLAKNPSYPCPISSVYDAYPVEIEKRKNGAKTEYVISIDNESEPVPLTKEELTALMGAPRIPEIIYRYTRYHLGATVEFLKQCDGIYGMSLMETDEMKTVIDTLDGELPKEDTSAFSFDRRTKDNRENGREGGGISLDDLFERYDELQRQELGDKTEEGQELRAMIRGYIEQEGLSVRVTRSTSNRELLDLIESEMEGPKPSDEPEDVPGEEEEQPEETEEQEKKIAGYLFYQPGSALEQAQNLIREYIDALCMISCISLQELQQKVSYADSYEKNRRFWLDSFTEVLEHCIADNSVLPDVDCPLFAKQLMNMLLNLYLEGGTRQEMDAFGWAFLRGIATHRGIEWLDGKKPNS